MHNAGTYILPHGKYNSLSLSKHSASLETITTAQTSAQHLAHIGY